MASCFYCCPKIGHQTPAHIRVAFEQIDSDRLKILQTMPKHKRRKDAKRNVGRTEKEVATLLISG